MIILFLTLQILVFAGASLFHFGVFVKGYEHQKACFAESIIGLILLIGLVVCLIFPEQMRTAGLAVQGIALFGTFVGVFTIAVGVGPRTVPDFIFHACMIALLIAGLIITNSSTG